MHANICKRDPFVILSGQVIADRPMLPGISHISILSLTLGFNNLSELLLEGVLEGNGVSSELADTLTELLDSHLILVEVESEESLVLDVSLLLEIERRGLGSIELLGDVLGGVEELLEQVRLWPG